MCLFKTSKISVPEAQAPIPNTPTPIAPPEPTPKAPVLGDVKKKSKKMAVVSAKKQGVSTNPVLSGLGFPSLGGK